VPRRLFIGTAGWSIPRALAPQCGGPGTHLERYARRFAGTEINSSFYRPHAAATYAKWASRTPVGFQFAVKVPRHITHELALRRALGASRALAAIIVTFRAARAPRRMSRIT